MNSKLSKPVQQVYSIKGVKAVKCVKEFKTTNTGSIKSRIGKMRNTSKMETTS